MITATDARLKMQQVDRLIVTGIKIDPLLQLNKGGECLLAILHPAMGNGYPVAESGTAETFA